MTASSPLPGRFGLIAALGSGALLGGALWFQHGMGLAPCELCHWQRYPHAVAVVAGLGAAFFARHARAFALILVLIAIMALVTTAVIALYHVGVEYRFWPGPQSCSGNLPHGLSVEQLKRYLLGARLVRCDEVPWAMWGLSMAAWNAILSAFVALATGLGLKTAISDHR